MLNRSKKDKTQHRKNDSSDSEDSDYKKKAKNQFTCRIEIRTMAEVEEMKLEEDKNYQQEAPPQNIEHKEDNGETTKPNSY